MKYSFTLICIMICISSLFGQNSLRVRGAMGQHSHMLTGLLSMNERQNVERKSTSGLTERVIAQSVRDNTLAALADSVNLRYTLSRGSSYDYNNMLYPYNYPYSTSPMFNYGGIFTKPQVLFDTFMHWEVNPNTLVYGYYETAYAGYDAHNNLKSYQNLFVDSSVYPNMVYSNNFNAAGNIDTGYWSIWAHGTADSAFKQFFTYNSANKLIKDSTYELHLGTWRLVSRSLYTYDAANDLTQIDNYSNDTDTSFTQPLIEQLKYINTYDGSHRLLTVASSYFNGTILAPYVRDTFAYSGVLTYHNSWKEYQWDGINSYWAPIVYMHKVINVTSGLPDTVHIMGFDSLANTWIPQTMDVMSYDTAHNPVKLKDYEYNFTSFPSSPSFTTTYYYGPYVASGVPEVDVMDNIKVFPNPASDILTILGSDNRDVSGVSVSIINVSGQMISKESLRWRGKAEISVKDLMPGMYWIIVRDGNGQLLHRQSVIKQ